jgi:hypothetical protein
MKFGISGLGPPVIRAPFHHVTLARMNSSEKRAARQKAGRLKSLGLVTIVPRSDEERLREAKQALRSEDAYAQSAACTDCEKARRDAADATALCAHHLRLAMGV